MVAYLSAVIGNFLMGIFSIIANWVSDLVNGIF